MNTHGTQYCHDCEVDTFKIKEYYMVHDSLWDKYGKGTMLCIGCLEKRIGRCLNKSDFSDAPINDNLTYMKSKRLKRALKR